MITSKHTRCCRFTWAYITRYPYVSARDIANAQHEYTWGEVVDALSRLEREGFVRRAHERQKHGHYQWQAVIPFVVLVPAWAA